MRGRKRAGKGQLSLNFVEKSGELRRFWQRRYYDFNVYSRAKVIEKLHYMHANPVQEDLVTHPGHWPWSSWCFYHGRDALLEMDAWNAPSLEAAMEIRLRKEQSCSAIVQRKSEERPTLCKKPDPQRVGHPRGSRGLRVRHPPSFPEFPPSFQSSCQIKNMGRNEEVTVVTGGGEGRGNGRSLPAGVGTRAVRRRWRAGDSG